MTDIILTEIKNGVGIITLNSPKTLNSINLELAKALSEKLEEWRDNEEVHCLLLQGNEKAFCAGGDVKRLYNALKDNSQETINSEALEFFIKEYSLDYKIHTYIKPIIAWGNGIVMGGGIGIFYGASHRIVTEKSQLAMPEITIGLYPDVGATWFLNKMPEKWGYYFGLTGARMNAGDALFLGLADYCIEAQLREVFIKKLTSQDWSHNSEENKKVIDNLIKAIATIKTHSPAREHTSFSKKLSLINSFLDFESLLKTEAPQDEWLNQGYMSFSKGSPTSALVTYEQLKRGASFSLKEVFCSELNLSVHFSKSLDFPEGIRALLIDKDQKPKWIPEKLEDVSESHIQSYFLPIWNQENNPLNNLL